MDARWLKGFILFEDAVANSDEYRPRGCHVATAWETIRLLCASTTDSAPCTTRRPDSSLCTKRPLGGCTSILKTNVEHNLKRAITKQRRPIQNPACLLASTSDFSRRPTRPPHRYANKLNKCIPQCLVASSPVVSRRPTRPPHRRTNNMKNNPQQKRQASNNQATKSEQASP